MTLTPEDINAIVAKLDDTITTRANTIFEANRARLGWDKAGTVKRRWLAAAGGAVAATIVVGPICFALGAWLF